MDVGLALKPGIAVPDLIVPPDIYVADERGTLLIWYSQENWCEKSEDCRAIMIMLSNLICRELHDSYRYVECNCEMEDVISGGWSDNPFNLAIVHSIGYRRYV